jgi:hypothetical protein
MEKTRYYIKNIIKGTIAGDARGYASHIVAKGVAKELGQRFEDYGWQFEVYRGTVA